MPGAEAAWELPGSTEAILNSKRQSSRMPPANAGSSERPEKGTVNEMKEWDILSDEALASFEKSL